MLKKYSAIILAIYIFSGCQNKSNPDISRIVEIKYEDGRAQLIRYGKPYHIIGGAGHEHMEKLALYGGNSIRTWNTQKASEILDDAHSFGLTVTLGLEVGNEWWGDDFSYWNFNKVDQKIEGLRKTIKEFKDHPALLMWGIGNEVHLFGGNRWIVYHTINKIAKMIHEEDPNHPVMTAIPVGFKYDRYTFSHLLMPDVDILGFNAFDRLPYIYSLIYERTGWKKAYILSEWGASGPWESNTTEWGEPPTEWGAPKELSSTQKAKIVSHYWDIIKNDDHLYLGGYAFYWGHKIERTHTWFSLFSEEGLETETVNVLQNQWSENKPNNWAPQIDSLQLIAPMRRDNFYLVADSVYTANIFANDLDQDSLTFRWELRPEDAPFFGSDKFKNNMRHLLLSENYPSTQFRTPTEEGPYRLFAFVYDGKGHVAHKNIPFYVILSK